MKKSQQFDQFFTNPIVAFQCFEFLKQNIDNLMDYFYLEPSAGKGAFLFLLPESNRLGLDIDPQHPEIVFQDFLKFESKFKSNKVISIGNPPFGRNSSLAIQFFNKAAIFSEVIAFIVPKTFKKHSLISKLNPYFHLKNELILEENSFTIEGNSFSIPCIFQIWIKLSQPRVSNNQVNLVHPDFVFCNKDTADFAIRRVGRLAGKVLIDFESYAKSSHYFIKSINAECLDTFKSIDWSSIKHNTAGVPSISKKELISGYILKKLAI